MGESTTQLTAFEANESPNMASEKARKAIQMRRKEAQDSLNEQFVDRLKSRVKPTPDSMKLGVNLKKRLGTPIHSLQDNLSYVTPIDLHQRPKVFIKRKSGAKELAKCGIDMFRRAGVPYDQPLVVIRQDAKTHDVTISAIQALDWLSAINSPESSEDLLEIVPAGSFSYRKDYTGTMVRLVFNVMRYTSPKIFLGKLVPVRLAAVVIPEVIYNGERHLVITQRVRKRNGSYNSLYVFPGGHVEGGELLEEGAIREFREETGLDLKIESLRLQCCWQEVNPSKRLHFLMVVYSGSVVSYSDDGEFSFGDIALQKDEVGKLVLLPESTWEGVAHRQDLSGISLPAAIVDGETGAITNGSVKANEVTGFQAGFGHGIGSAHRYALLNFLDHPSDSSSTSGSETAPVVRQITAHRLSILRKSTKLEKSAPQKVRELTRSWSQSTDGDESVISANQMVELEKPR